jgi:hypothetical protein
MPPLPPPPLDPDILDILLRLEGKVDSLENKVCLILVRVAPETGVLPVDDEWLTARQAMEFLYMEERTFYRRKSEVQGKWVVRRVGKKWLYLKSSL